MLQEMANIVPCPSVHYFKASQQILQDTLSNDVIQQVSVEDALDVMEKLNKELRGDDGEPFITHDLQLSLADFSMITVPEIGERNYENIIGSWLKDLEARRNDLLKFTVSWYLHVGKLHNSDISIPYQEIILHRFVEEIAALRKCLEVSDKKKIHFVRLMSLLAHRMNWLLKTYQQLTEGILLLLISRSMYEGWKDSRDDISINYQTF